MNHITTIEEYLNELKEKSAISLEIPDHPIISEAEFNFSSDDDLQRFYLFLNLIFIRRRSFIKRPYKGNNVSITFENESILYSYFLRTIFTQDKESLNNILSILEKFNICNKSREIIHDTFSTTLNVYKFNPLLLNTIKFKVVKINKRKVLNSYFKHLFNHYVKLPDVQKNILNKNIIKVDMKLSREEFNTLYYAPRLEEKKLETIKRRKDNNKKLLPLQTREEYIEEFNKSASLTYSNIEDLNTASKYLRFLYSPLEDTYGHRFFHCLLNIPKVLRWKMNMDKINILKPLFEIDLVASQPTINAIMMEREGVIDKDYFNDVSNISPDFYNNFSNRLNHNISRKNAKDMSMKLLFGRTSSINFKKFMGVYPELCKYLSIKKSRSFEQLEEELQVLPKAFKYSSSNCMDLQRAESMWTTEVWKMLLEDKIRFIPIHDSVLIFGNSKMSEQDAIALSRKISKKMLTCLKMKNSSLITPHLKTTFNPDIYPITNEEIY